MSETSTQTTPEQRRRAFVLLFGCLMVTGIGNSMLFAILPPIARRLDIAEVFVGMVYTLAATLFILTSPLWGRVSDRFGRRPIIVMGMAAYMISMGLIAIFVSLGLSGIISATATIILLILSRGLSGGMGSASGPAAQAYVADRTTPQTRVESLAALTAAMGMGAAVGPGVAAWMGGRIGLVSPLIGVAVLAGGMAAMIWFTLPERTPPQQKGPSPSTFSSFSYAKDPRVSPFLIFGIGIWIVQAVTLQTINFYVMDTLGVGGAEATELAGAVLMGGAFAMLISQLVLIPRIKASPRTLMLLGAGVAFVANIFLAMAGSFGEIFFAFAVSGIGIGLSRPGMAGGASLAVTPSEQGAVAGMVNSTAGIGFLSAPFVGLLTYQTFGPSVPYWINVGVIAASLVYVWMSPRIKASSAPLMPGIEDTHDLH